MSKCAHTWTDSKKVQRKSRPCPLKDGVHVCNLPQHHTGENHVCTCGRARVKKFEA